jgi:hypothetical protein
VTVTFEKKNRSFERLLLAKTSGAILFGVVKAFVPILMAAFLIDLDHVDWAVFLKPLSYALPLTYGADMLHGAINGGIWRSSPCSVSVYSW